MNEIIVVLVVAAVVAVLGIRIGMLLAPRLERWGAPPDDAEAQASDDDKR